MLPERLEIGWEVLEVKYLVVSMGYRLSLDSMSFSSLARVFSSVLVRSRVISRCARDDERVREWRTCMFTFKPLQNDADLSTFAFAQDKTPTPNLLYRFFIITRRPF